MKPNKIYLYQREDGSFGADYDIIVAKRRGKLYEIFSISTVEQIEELLARQINPRVRALAERAIVEKGGQIPAPPMENVPVKAVIPPKPLTWWERIKGILI